jgi:hypothetical protein
MYAQLVASIGSRWMSLTPFTLDWMGLFCLIFLPPFVSCRQNTVNQRS